jgi:hypothetical protein
MNETFSLSIEEFGLGLLLLGETSMLQAWLKAHGIEWDETVVRERFSAAAHSLITHGLIYLDSSGSLVLSEALRQTLWEVTHPLYSLSFSLVKGQEEHRRVYHIGSKNMVSQEWRFGGGYYLERTPFSLENLHAQAVTYFRISPAFALNETVEIPLKQFENPEEATDLPDSLRKWLIEDRKHELFRGSISRIDYLETGPVSNYACLVLGSPHRTWLFRLLPLEKRIRICPSSPEGLREELLLLIERRYR